jgi:hypothetical protein
MAATAYRAFAEFLTCPTLDIQGGSIVKTPVWTYFEQYRKIGWAAYVCRQLPGQALGVSSPLGRNHSQQEHGNGDDDGTGPPSPE